MIESVGRLAAGVFGVAIAASSCATVSPTTSRSIRCRPSRQAKLRPILLAVGVPVPSRPATARTTTATARSTKASTPTVTRTPSCAVGGKLADCDDKDPRYIPARPRPATARTTTATARSTTGSTRTTTASTRARTARFPSTATNQPGDPSGRHRDCTGKDDDCNNKTDEIPASMTGSLVAPSNPTGSGGVRHHLSGWAQLTQDVADQSGALCVKRAVQLRHVRHELDVLDPDKPTALTA